MIKSNDDFSDILKPSELVLWRGYPGRMAYLADGLGLFVFGLLWGLVDLSVLVGAIISHSLSLSVVLFLLIHALPFYLGVWGIVRRLLEHRSVSYAFTDQRVIVKNEFLGVNYESIDYSYGLRMDVKVGLVESFQNRGSIRFVSDSFEFTTGPYKMSSPNLGVRKVKFVGIKDPYAVYKELGLVINSLEDN